MNNYGIVVNNLSEIKKLINQGYSSYKIAKILGCAKSSVLKCLKNNGIKTQHKCKSNKNNLLKDKLDKVLTLYLEDKTCSFIGKELGHSEVAVIQLLNKYGYDTSFTYKVDELFFEKIDSEEKAYVLGWMYSDGNVMPEGKLRICLNQKDEEIILKIKDILEYEGPLYYKKERNSSEKQVELCINRKKMTDDLNKLGVIPAKSLVIDFPTFDQVPQNLIHHFVRGVFDGDGSISNGIMICGSYLFTQKLAQIIPCKITNIYQRYKDRKPEKSAHQLFIGRRQEIQKFINWLYMDATIYLNRKKLLIDEYLKIGV